MSSPVTQWKNWRIEVITAWRYSYQVNVSCWFYLVNFLIERVSLKAVKVQIFIQVRDLFPSYRRKTSTRWKWESSLRCESWELYACDLWSSIQRNQPSCAWQQTKKKRLNSRTIQLLANIALITHDSVTESAACDLPNLVQSNQSLWELNTREEGTCLSWALILSWIFAESTASVVSCWA